MRIATKRSKTNSIQPAGSKEKSRVTTEEGDFEEFELIFALTLV